MGNRLSKIYTKTGDDGTTGLGDGTRVSKDSIRVDAYGTIDEANSAIGLILSAPNIPDDIRECLTSIQHELFELGGELCIPGHTSISNEQVIKLEHQLDNWNKELPPLKDFILPGGGIAAASAHMSRTIVRRAERIVIKLSKKEQVRPEVIRYLNRLSDLLFVAARILSRDNLSPETLWQRKK